MTKTIMVTGATSGFGEAIATLFASHGYTVIATGRRADRLQHLKATLESRYQARVIPQVFDVRNKAEVSAAIAEVKLQVDAIDLLVNNAGLAAGLSSIENGDTDDWDAMIDTNVKGLLYVTREVAPMMTERASGHIINIGSTASKTVYKNGNVYCATKFAVDALTQAMRIDLLQFGIKVTAIHPGMAETEFSVVRFKGDEQRAKNVYADINPIRPEDVADVVWYCANVPAHICINDLTLTCLTQANSVYSIKEADRVKK
jgi:3-hydroxy acid dehydrogenase / malonic semialdehyde reductase